MKKFNVKEWSEENEWLAKKSFERFKEERDDLARKEVSEKLHH